jgi:hypothetical protein
VSCGCGPPRPVLDDTGAQEVTHRVLFVGSERPRRCHGNHINATATASAEPATIPSATARLEPRAHDVLQTSAANAPTRAAPSTRSLRCAAPRQATPAPHLRAPMPIGPPPGAKGVRCPEIFTKHGLRAGHSHELPDTKCQHAFGCRFRPESIVGGVTEQGRHARFIDVSLILPPILSGTPQPTVPGGRNRGLVAGVPSRGDGRDGACSAGRRITHEAEPCRGVSADAAAKARGRLPGNRSRRGSGAAVSGRHSRSCARVGRDDTHPTGVDLRSGRTEGTVEWGIPHCPVGGGAAGAAGLGFGDSQSADRDVGRREG